jgi:HSP20 family molecular chaperone IbpA
MKRFKKEFSVRYCTKLRTLSGKFRRTFAVPQSMQEAQMKASYNDGVLEVVIVKPEKILPKQIEIKSKL